MENQKPLEWEEIQESPAPERKVLLDMPEYQRLTKKQQLFVDAYCNRNGSPDGKFDPVSATMVAYQCKNRNVARVMSYGLMQNVRIIEVLNRFFKRTPPQEFIISLDRAIRNKHLSNAQVQALRMKCAVLGFANRLPHSHTAPVNADKDAPEIKKPARKKKRAPKNTKPAEKALYENMVSRF